MFRSGKVISHIYHMLDCVQHSSSVLIHYLWNPSQWKQYQKVNVTIFCATFSIKAFYKITVEQHIKTSKGLRSNSMLNDDHKHWKVKTVTSLTHSVYRLYMYKRLVCELRLMPLVWIGGKFWRSPFMNPLDGGSATKNFPWIRTSQPASRQMSDGKA